jgi:flagellar biosynthesis/type III secretory pathway protein FliH
MDAPMSRVIKRQQTAATDVRPIRSVWRREPLTPQEDPEIVALRLQCAELSRQLEVTTAETRNLQDEVERSYREGEAVGRKLGLQEAEETGAAALAALEAGLERAVAAYREELNSLERLAPLLAREALGLIIEDQGDRAGLMEAVIRTQLGRLSDLAVLRVEVSREDFGAPSELVDRLGRTGLDLTASDSLRSGDCRIRLKLGSVEAGIGQQWERLYTLLGDMAEAQP